VLPMPALLDWTGHALIDVGIATICRMVGKTDPCSLTTDDLGAAAKEMDRYYFSGALNSYLTCVFMNSEYVQPETGANKATSRKLYAERNLYAFRSPPDSNLEGEICAFSGLPASHRIHRGQMPMLTGEEVLNFFPNGAGGLNINGAYLTALQALPLGGRRSEGRLFIAHADNPNLTLALAGSFLEDNRRLITLAMSNSLPNKQGVDESLPREQASWDTVKKRAKYPDAKSPFSLIADDLLRTLGDAKLLNSVAGPVSLTIYWLSSSGQGPSLEIYPVPSNLLNFLRRVEQKGHARVFRALVARSWQLIDVNPVAKTKGKKQPESRGPQLGGPGRSTNRLLADLFSVYQAGFIDLHRAATFLRRHLLLSSKTFDIERSGRWGLAEFFLEEVLSMSPDRIKQIKDFADKLAEYISTRNDKGFFQQVVYAKFNRDVRNALVKAQRNELLSKNSLLFTLDQYLAVFEADDAVGAINWSLIRDLISIRLMEKLHESGWLTPEKLSSETEEENELVTTGE